MVHKQNSHCIVMVAQFMERNVRKVHQYIPLKMNETITFGRYRITLVKENVTKVRAFQ